MAPQFEYSVPSDAKDFEQLGTILAQSFITSLEDGERYSDRIGKQNFRILRQGNQIVGGLALISMGQWWNGQCVPMTGIAAVGIAPEYRGSGAAIALMQQTLKELHRQQVPLSVLYPATQRLYRKAGYEQGGTACTWEASSTAIQIQEQFLKALHSQALPVHSIAPDHEILQTLYRQRASTTNGNLDRASAIWKGLLETDEKELIYAYLFGSLEQPEGYVLFSQHRAADASVLQIRDWGMLTTAAGQKFWSFLAGHRSQIDKVQWKGSAIDPLMLLLSEQSAKPKFCSYWMLRIVDVNKALAQRGYPPTAQTDLHLDVQDDLLPENNGKFVLSVSNGRGEVTQGGKGELKLDIRGLAPLYTGLFTPDQLRLAGYLDAPERAVSTATQLFSGMAPWMPDFF